MESCDREKLRFNEPLIYIFDLFIPVFIKVTLNLILINRILSWILTHKGLVMPYGIMKLVNAGSSMACCWRNHTIIWNNVSSSMVFCAGTHLRAISNNWVKILKCEMSLSMTHFAGTNELTHSWFKEDLVQWTLYIYGFSACGRYHEIWSLLVRD